MEARDVAQALFNKVMDYCENERRTSITYENPLECISRYEPDKLLEFVNSHLTDEDKDIKEAIQNANKNFLTSVKKEYEVLWKKEIARELGELLSDEMYGLYENIAQSAELDDAEKARRLEAYARVLDRFSEVVKRALQERKPLHERDLLNWFDKMGDAVFGIKNYNYYEIMGYYIGFYNLLNKADKLEVLSTLLDVIGSVLSHIDEDLEELSESKTLTNES